MGRRTRDDHGIPSDRHPARAVHDRQLEDPELLSRALDELRQSAQGHRLVDLVVEGPHIRIGAHRAEEDDDSAGVVPAHAVDDRLDVDPVALDLDHRPPPLTGGKRATSSPSRNTTSGRTTSWFTARSMLFSWPRRRGYFPRTASTSCSTVVPSRNVPRNARNTGMAALGSTSSSRHNRSARLPHGVNLT